MATIALSALKVARMISGESQESLALDTNVDARTWRRFEGREYPPDRQFLARASRVLGVPIVSADSPGAAANNFVKQLEDVWRRVGMIRDVTYDDEIAPDQVDAWEEIRQQICELVVAGVTMLEVPYEHKKDRPTERLRK